MQKGIQKMEEQKSTRDGFRVTVLIILEALQSLLQNTLIVAESCPPLMGLCLKDKDHHVRACH